MKWVGIILSLIVIGIMTIEYIHYDVRESAINRIVLEIVTEM